MKHNENLIDTLVEEAKFKQMPLYQAVAEYTDEHDIDPSMLLKELDANFIARIRESAIDNDPHLAKFNTRKTHKIDTSFFFGA